MFLEQHQNYQIVATGHQNIPVSELELAGFQVPSVPELRRLLGTEF